MTVGRSMDGSVSYDVVCAGPVTLDVTLAGLEELPRPGEERFGSEVVFAPGAFATIAVAAARLGLEAAVVAPRPRDLAGAFLASALADEGVDWLGPESDRSAVTFVMPVGGDRALASYDPGSGVDRSLLASLNASAVVCGIGEVGSAAGARVYVMAADNAAALDGMPRVRAVFANEAEAARLTGAPDAVEAVCRLAASADLAVVTRAAAGALGCEDGAVIEVAAPAVRAADTTGAGDVFAAAFVWAERGQLPLDEKLHWAVLAAALSVERVGALASAPSLGDLLKVGRAQGFQAPA
jgi:sugar/nucleoside kinase (ribokinase family)